MNQRLIDTLQAPMTSDNRRRIARLITASKPFDDGSGLEYLDNAGLIKLLNIAAAHVAAACAVVSQQDDPEMRWQNLLGTQTITENLAALLTNPAITNFTQA